MRIADVLSMALGNLARRLGRTLLTLIGVVIGVAAIVLLVSLGIGLKLEIQKVFRDDDEQRTIRVTRVLETGKDDQTPFAFLKLPFDSVPISDRDLEELRRLPDVETVVPDLNLILEARIDGDSTGPVPVAGAVPADLDYLRRHLKQGRVWTAPDERACLVSSLLLQVRTRLTPEEILDREIVFSRGRKGDPEGPRTFKITGILDSDTMGLRGRQLFVPWDRAVDLREAVKGGIISLGYEADQYLSVEVRAAGVGAVADLKNRLKNLNYQVLTSADIIGKVDTIFLVVEGFMACVGAIGLVVALFGIANTMMMSVLERTREIGIMKALGARNRDIRRIFLLEAAAIGTIGGLAGLGVGTAASSALGWIVGQFVNLPPSVHLFHVSSWLAAGAVLFAVAVSIMAGMIPAARAAGLDPVRALRYE